MTSVALVEDLGVLYLHLIGGDHRYIAQPAVNLRT